MLDNLNTHSKASLYEAFPPAETKRAADRLAFHPTPKHAGWLNIAGIDLALLTRQCLDRRFGDRDTLGRGVPAWEAARQEHAVIRRG